MVNLKTVDVNLPKAQTAQTQLNVTDRHRTQVKWLALARAQADRRGTLLRRACREPEEPALRRCRPRGWDLNYSGAAMLDKFRSRDHTIRTCGGMNVDCFSPVLCIGPYYGIFRDSDASPSESRMCAAMDICRDIVLCTLARSRISFCTNGARNVAVGFIGLRILVIMRSFVSRSFAQRQLRVRSRSAVFLIARIAECIVDAVDQFPSDKIRPLRCVLQEREIA